MDYYSQIKEQLINNEITTLKRMRQFYLLIQKGVAMQHQLTISHINALLPLKNANEINYYMNLSINQNLGYRELRTRIKNKEYERLDDSTKKKLINKENTSIDYHNPFTYTITLCNYKIKDHLTHNCD